MMSLSDRVQRASETEGDEMTHRFANGLTIRTEVFLKGDPRRILPIGGPQGSLMNHMLHFPECVAGKRVFEPFAGSGPLGFMALQLGAAHASFLDINPRAVEFQLENARRNGFEARAFTCSEGDIADFKLAEKCDIVFSNPPFVPTPEGLGGSLTSAGGGDGNRFVSILLKRLEEFLVPEGRALVYVFQFTKAGVPLVVERIDEFIEGRTVEITPSQKNVIPMDTYVAAYRRVFAADEEAIATWSGDLTARYGNDLGLCHYVIDIGPRTAAATTWEVRDNFEEKFGPDFLAPSEDEYELAIARVFENLVPPPPGSAKEDA